MRKGCKAGKERRHDGTGKCGASSTLTVPYKLNALLVDLPLLLRKAIVAFPDLECNAVDRVCVSALVMIIQALGKAVPPNPSQTLTASLAGTHSIQHRYTW